MQATEFLSNIQYYLQFSSVTQSCPTLCSSMDCSVPSFPVHHQLPEFTQTHVHWVSDAIQPSHPLLYPSPTFNISQHQGLFKWVSFHIRCPKYWSFSFSINPSNEHSGLISFRMDWFGLLAVQGTLLQHHSSKALTVWCSTFWCSSSHRHTWLLEKTQLWLYGPLSEKWCLCFLIHCVVLS